MVGARAKGRKSKSKALAVVPDEPEPLNVINAEASDGPYGELQKIDDLNNESVLDSVDEHENEYVATDEMYDEEEGSGFAIDNMIVEGNETVYTTEDTDEEGVSDGGDAVTDDVDNGNEGANEEEMEEEEEEEPVSCDSENEDVHAEEEEPEEDASDGGDGDAVGTNINVENDNDRSNEETDEEEEEDEEPVSCGSDNEDVHSDEEGEEEEEEEEEEEPDEDMSDGGDIAANVDVENDKANEETEEDEEPVSRGSDNEDLRTGEEEDEEGRAATELVLVGNLSETRDNDREVNELTTEKPINAPAENEAHETASTANGIKIVAEKDVPPKKKIIRRRLIKKKIPPGKAVAGKDEDQMQPLNGNEGASDEAKPRNLEDNDGNLKNEEKERIPTVKVIRKRVRNRKKRPQVQSEKPKPTNDEPLSRVNESIEQKTANEGAESDRKNKKVQVEGTQKVNAKEDIDKPGSSKSGKSSKKVESQGMIFICSSDTKKDCYRYKVFGLPAAKKDVVSRIYKGMRLFLFDVDLRMLYGVYKAASPGSYNVEPKAFKSRYPSQVRFTVMEDGLPVPEAKFRKVIKDNYYTNSKFDCHLNSEQVRNLCKLFRETRKPESNRGHRGVQSQLPFTSRPSRVNRKRKRVDDVRRVEGRAISSRDRERRRKRPEEVGHTRIVRDREEPRRALVVRGRDEMRRASDVRGRDEMRRASDVRSREESRRVSAVRRREEMRHVDVVRSREEMTHVDVVRSHEEVRRAPLDIDERYHHPVVIYDGEAYLPSVESSALYQSLRAEDPARSRIYSYERPRGIDTYRRDSGIIYRDVGISGSRESRHHAEQIARDPYTTYREPQVYREPAYETDTRRERRSYSPAERRYASDYQRPDDYYSPLTLHRRY